MPPGLMGVAPPPEVAFAEADLSPMARSFYEGNRRIANRRIRDELGVAPPLPDLPRRPHGALAGRVMAGMMPPAQAAGHSRQGRSAGCLGA